APETRNVDGPLACTDPWPVDSITIVPTIPLDQMSTYAVALLEGLQGTVNGAPVAYGPAFTWALIRSAENPVTLDDQGNVVADRTPLNPVVPEELALLRGIDLLLNAHVQVLRILGALGCNRATGIRA